MGARPAFRGRRHIGGEEGALNGPSIMPGGPRSPTSPLGPLLENRSTSTACRAAPHPDRTALGAS